jgi:hypothetical protein
VHAGTGNFYKAYRFFLNKQFHSAERSGAIAEVEVVGKESAQNRMLAGSPNKKFRQMEFLQESRMQITAQNGLFVEKGQVTFPTMNCLLSFLPYPGGRWSSRMNTGACLSPWNLRAVAVSGVLER